jgi:hypothetical protein
MKAYGGLEVHLHALLTSALGFLDIRSVLSDIKRANWQTWPLHYTFTLYTVYKDKGK